MWIVMNNGSAVENVPGDEIYYELCSDGLVRVYKNHRPIYFSGSVADAQEFIKKLVEDLNNEEDKNGNKSE